MTDTRHLLFVYGTLKQGHRNAHVNAGIAVPGRWCTVTAYPLYVLGPSYLPWLSEEPGQGLPVQGELVEADADQLARMDALEQLDKPLWYRRGRVRLRCLDRGTECEAWAYFGAPERVRLETVHAGPLASYTLALAARFAQRPGAVADAQADQAAFPSTPRY